MKFDELHRVRHNIIITIHTRFRNSYKSSLHPFLNLTTMTDYRPHRRYHVVNPHPHTHDTSVCKVQPTVWGLIGIYVVTCMYEKYICYEIPFIDTSIYISLNIHYTYNRNHKNIRSCIN